MESVQIHSETVPLIVEEIDFQSITINDKGEYVVQLQPDSNLVFLGSEIVRLENGNIIQEVQCEVPVENRISNSQYETRTYYQCKICDKVFSQRGNLIRHERIHTGDKPFHCDLCGQKFTQKANLQKHIDAHNSDKKLECEVCNRGFVQKANMKRHLRIHTDEKPFKCDKCSQKFIQKSNLDKHVKLNCSAGHYTDDNSRIQLESHSAKLRHRNRVHGDQCTKTDKTEIEKRPIILKCAGCPAVFRTQKQLIKHKKFHEYMFF